jgi:HK97 family phage portal protein
MKNKKRSTPAVKEARFQAISDDTAYGLSGVPTPEPFSDLSAAYAVHVWVYACVRAIATNIAGIQLLPYVKKGDSWIVDEKNEFGKLLESPNPYMSGYNLREYTTAAMKLTGNAYWGLERLGTRDVQEIWPLIPGNVRAVATRDRMIDHYVYTVNGQETRFAYDEVIQFRSMNPDSYIYGLGNVSPAKNAIATDIFAQVWNKTFFSNSARPSAVLESEDTLPDDVRTRVKESWKQLYQGAEKHGKTAILEKLKLKIVSESAKDMDFVNLRKDLRVEILAAFGVPPSVVGLLEFANYSNMDQQIKMFWTNTLIPEIRNIEQTLTMRARQITFKQGVVYQADLSKVEALQPNLKAQADTAAAFVNIGIPVNQVIDALDLPFKHVLGGDEPRPAPGASLLPPPAAAGAPADAPKTDAPAGDQTVKVSEDQVLNGAQISAAVDIVVAVAAGEIPRDAGIGQLIVLFNLTPEQAAQIMGSAGNPKIATTPNPRPNEPTDNPAAPPAPPAEPKKSIIERIKDVVSAARAGRPAGSVSEGASQKAATSAADRAARWREFDNSLSESEARFSTAARGFFAGQKRRVLALLTEKAPIVVREAAGARAASWDRKEVKNTVDVIFNETQETALMGATFERIIRATYRDFALRMTGSIDDSFDFNLKDPFAEAWIKNKASKLVREATRYTQEQLSDEIADAVQEAAAAGFAESETIAQIAERISAVYEFARDTRAERIARTETISAANAGGLEAMRQTGVQIKEWLSSKDDKVRPTHEELDGTKVGIGEAFLSSSGAQLQFPGDPAAPAAEVVQCRCTLIAVAAPAPAADETPR